MLITAEEKRKIRRNLLKIGEAMTEIEKILIDATTEIEKLIVGATILGIPDQEEDPKEEEKKETGKNYDKKDWEGKFFMMKKTAEFLAEKVPFWISTKEEDPTPNERVLVYHSKYGVTVGFMHTWGEWDISRNISRKAYPENPTHWMPLPEPPKDGE